MASHELTSLLSSLWDVIAISSPRGTSSSKQAAPPSGKVVAPATDRSNARRARAALAALLRNAREHGAHYSKLLVVSGAAAPLVALVAKAPSMAFRIGAVELVHLIVGA